jgi:hypothetical protein
VHRQGLSVKDNSSGKEIELKNRTASIKNFCIAKKTTE